LKKKTMPKRTILQRMLNKLDGTNERTASAIRDFEGGVKNLRERLQQEISASTLEEVNLKMNKLRKSVDLEPIQSAVQSLHTNFNESVKSLLGDIETKSTELKTLTLKGDGALTARADQLMDELENLRSGLDTLVSSNRSELNLINNELGRILESSKSFATKTELGQISNAGIQMVKVVEQVKNDEMKGMGQSILSLRELISRVNRGGGNMNRQITVANVDPLTKYTDINFVAGNNMVISTSVNETTKRVNFTFTSSGGGGSVVGTSRQIQTTTISSTIAGLSGIDQVTLANGGLAITLPTAVGDSQLYTIKNVGNSSVAILTTGGETIDNQPNIIMPVQYTSVDLISDSLNWNIT